MCWWKLSKTTSDENFKLLQTKFLVCGGSGYTIATNIPLNIPQMILNDTPIDGFSYVFPIIFPFIDGFLLDFQCFLMW